MNPAKHPRLGLAHFTVLEVPPLDLVTLAARTGFSSIGLRLYPAFPGSPCYELPRGSRALQEMRARLSDENVSVHDIEFVVIDGDFAVAPLAPILESAQALGARRLSVGGDDPDRARLVENFASLCDLAAGFQMGVDIEFMAWRSVANLHDAAAVVKEAGRTNGGVLIDALHLSRTGGTARDVRGLPREIVRSAQLCDAPAVRPITREAIIHEARAKRLPPGEGELPLRDLLASLPEDAAISVEVPMENSGPAEMRARRIFEATQRLFATEGPV
jgi:sugar phosphate isomerase/epimerase